MPETSREQGGPSHERRSAVRWAWRIASVGTRSLTLAALAICAASPELIFIDWRFDLIASVLAQVCLAGIVLSLWQAVFRRWIWCALFVVVTAGGFSWMLRVERAPRAGAGDIGTELSVLVMNVHSRNDQDNAVFELIERTDADVVVIVESSWSVIRSLPSQTRLTDRYPHRDGMDPSSSGQIMVLSKLQLSGGAKEPGAPGLASSWGYRAGFLRLHGRPIRFAAVHAPSPRSRATWNYGQHTFTRLAQHFERVGPSAKPGIEPTIVAGDLNSPPTGLRSRLVTQNLGLRRAKPIAVWDGTFPASLPWFARSSIDGVFVSPGISVRSWKTVGIPGSDHRGVVVSLVVDAPSSE